jgi:hypothetical protein
VGVGLLPPGVTVAVGVGLPGQTVGEGAALGEPVGNGVGVALAVAPVGVGDGPVLAVAVAVGVEPGVDVAVGQAMPMATTPLCRASGIVPSPAASTWKVTSGSKSSA